MAGGGGGGGRGGCSHCLSENGLLKKGKNLKDVYARTKEFTLHERKPLPFCVDLFFRKTLGANHF